MTEHMIDIEPGRRLVVADWENANGHRFVTVTPQFSDRSGGWRLAHSGLILSPRVACELAPALVALAARIGGSPPEPTPSDQDREESRMP
jgi:hypothetical protein